MNRQKRKLKDLLHTSAMAAMLFLPLTSTAQDDNENELNQQTRFESGMLGRENGVEYQYDENQFGIQPWFESSLLGRENGRGGGYNIITEQFGSDDYGGFNIGTQIFGQEAPLGGGCLVLAFAGAAYAFKKRKNNNKK